MRFLILNTDYPEFLSRLYSSHPGLENQSYEEQMKVRNESLFGVADFYSSNLRKLGHEAYDIHANNEFMQKMWAREHGVNFDEPPFLKQYILRYVNGIAAKISLRQINSLLWPLVRSLDLWFYNILEAQIKYYKPDIVINQAMSEIGSNFLKEIKPYTRIVVGQIASPLPQNEDFSCYRVIISSLPNIVAYFRRIGIPSELNRFAFEPGILDVLGKRECKTLLSFVGSLSCHHETRINLLEHLCKCFDMEIWGQGFDGLAEQSLIRDRYRGKAWGIEMYRVLYNSKITLNHHIDIAESYANNMRLYEATGTGVLLITDWKENLHEIFEPGKEVVAYRSPEECVRLVKYYLEHNSEREAISRAGQERTLKEHNYYRRMQELEDIVCKYL